MARSTITAEFHCEIEKIWKVVTSLQDYAWRSDLERIEVIKQGKQFAEYTKEGYVTRFTITAFEPCKRYEFDMENDTMSGHWSGIFSYRDGISKIVFTEDVTAKKIVMKPFVKMYLRKQQEIYIQNLRKALNSQYR